MTRGWAALLTAVVVAVGCSSGSQRVDPPLLVPWHKIGDIGLGEPKARVVREYGRQLELGYRLHGGRVQVGFDGGQVTSIWFSTRYYRTKSGFGVGSRIPLGPLPQDGVVPLRTPLARLRLERVGQGEAVRLLDEGRPGPAIAACNGEELPQALVLHRRPPRPGQRLLLRVEVRRLTMRLKARTPSGSGSDS
jgi:hypothetical protein